MSLFDTFDLDSEEILKPLVCPVDGFPETVILTFEEKSLQALQTLCETQTAVTLRGGRDIPIYKFCWNGREMGLPQTLISGAWDARTWSAVPASDYETYLRIALEAASRL